MRPWPLAPQGPQPGAWGTLWGAFVAMGDHYGPNRQDSQEAFEDQVGRTNTLHRIYYDWDDAWPTVWDYWARDEGHQLLISWGAALEGGGTRKWKDIANGVYDADIDRVATGIKKLGVPIYFIFQHEPENDPGAGTPADFVSAYKHIHDRFGTKGVTNVSYVLTLMAFTFRYGDPAAYWPGASYVDYVAADGYNWHGCTGRDDPWTPFVDIFRDFYDYSLTKGKPALIAEYGTGEDKADPGRKGQWFDGAAATIKSWPNLEGVSYFNNGYGDPKCARWVDTSQSSLNAFIDMGADPYFDPATPAPPAGFDGYVGVDDDGYTSVVGTVSYGMTVDFLIEGPKKSHTVTDNSGMGWYDSGSLPVNAQWRWTYPGAGNYNLICTIHDFKLTIRVPAKITPTLGNLNTKFTLTWADSSPPSGYVYDVQIKRPRGSWELWKDDKTTKSAVFTADAGKGTYEFRTRMQKVSGGKASWYSESVVVSVG